MSPHANGSPHPAPEPAHSGARALPSHSGRRRNNWPWVLVLLALLGGAAGFGGYTLLYNSSGERSDVLLHKVKKEDLNVTVTEKGTLESADNRDVVCKVRAGNKGFASTINWVVDDGTYVKKSQLIMILDDSDFQDRYRDQKIKVDTALADKLNAEQAYYIQLKQNEIDIATSETNVIIAELDLNKYTGHKIDPALVGLGAVVGVPSMIVESGEYQQAIDDVTGRLRLEESNVEQNRERAAWADRMVKMRYMSPAQAQAERSKLESSMEAMRKLQTEKSILRNFLRSRMLAQLRSALDNAEKVLDQQKKKAKSSEIQADAFRDAKASVYLQELDKLREIEDQIRQCKIYAPQEGMVVYYKSESSSRFSSSSSNTGMIEQGAQVKEGQKLLRIPDLKHMQVNTKVHEAMVGRIKGDVRKSTGFFDSVRLGLLMNPNPLTRLVSMHDDNLERIRNKYRTRETYLDSPGQRASIRVDAMSERTFPGHVRSVAQMASQADSFSSDVKLYSTLVLIDEEVDGLKPDSTAEVTIYVDDVRQAVLAIPLQSVIGGTELGATRKVFVKANGGYEEREVKLGLANERMVEVTEGLQEGDEVVINPKVILGDRAKTFEVEDTRPRPGDASKGGTKNRKKAATPPKEPMSE